MDFSYLILPKVTVDYDLSPKDGRYYMLTFSYLENTDKVIYDFEEKKFYGWDTMLPSKMSEGVLHFTIPDNLLGYYRIEQFKSIFIFDNEISELFSEDIISFYGAGLLVKGAERAIIESVL